MIEQSFVLVIFFSALRCTMHYNTPQVTPTIGLANVAPTGKKQNKNTTQKNTNAKKKKKNTQKIHTKKHKQKNTFASPPALYWRISRVVLKWKITGFHYIEWLVLCRCYFVLCWKQVLCFFTDSIVVVKLEPDLTDDSLSNGKNPK